MSFTLPSVVHRYIEANNAHDASGISACFAENGVVHDEGEVLQGREAVLGWAQSTIAKYGAALQPTGLTESDGKTIVTCQVSGNFPGSPISLDFEFTLEQNEISALHIG